MDELKNRWGISGFCAKSRATTELAARLLLVVMAGRLAQSGRQEEIEISVSGGWAVMMRDGFTRLHEWFRSTAPQLKTVRPEHPKNDPFPAPFFTQIMGLTAGFKLKCSS